MAPSGACFFYKGDDMRFFRKLFMWAIVAVLGFFVYKKVKQFKDVGKLDKSLPEFLKNVVGEEPTVHICQSINSVTIKAGFSKDILDKNLEVENIINEYIEDFYPAVAKGHLNIVVFNKDEEDCNCEAGDNTCCCDCEEKEEETEEKGE